LGVIQFTKQCQFVPFQPKDVTPASTVVGILATELQCYPVLTFSLMPHYGRSKKNFDGVEPKLF